MTTSISLDKSTLPAFTDDLQVEVDQIREDYLNGALAQEFSLLRACRLIIEDKYRGIEINDEINEGKVAFASQEQFVRYVSELCNISRPTIFHRLAGYRILVKGLNKSYPDAFRVMVSTPGTPQRIESSGVAAFSQDGSIESVDYDKARALVPGLDDIPEGERQESVIHALAELAFEAGELDNRRDAASMVDHKLAKPSVRFFHENGDGRLVAQFTDRSTDEHGIVFDAPTLLIEWTPSQQPPEYVLKVIYEKLGASERIIK